MAASKLILCVCGAGINTSLNAEQRIQDYFRANKVKDIEVKHAMIGDIGPYKGRENMVVVWMTKIDPSFNAPSVQGLPFMIGSRKQKDELCKQIFDLMNEIYQP